MQVRPGSPAGHSDVTHNLSLRNDMSDFDLKTREVSKACRQPVAMVDDDQIAVIRLASCENHDAVGRRLDGRPVQPRNIQTQMDFDTACERVEATAEVTC